MVGTALRTVGTDCVIISMDRYELVERLGAGGFGSVFKATDKETNEVYAIKIMELTITRARAAANEWKLLSTLRHSNIVQCVGAIEENDKLHIVMEFCDKGDLSSLIKSDKELTETKVMEYLVQLSLAVSYIHRRNILHRDIKPANVFLTQNEMIKLGDFGLSKQLPEGVDMARSEVGTRRYYPPEILESQPYDSKCDVWGVGCILYELVTRKHAFQGRSRAPPSPIPSKYSGGVQRLVDLLLCHDPCGRPSMEEVLQDEMLEEAKKNVPIEDEYAILSEQPKENASSASSRGRAYMIHEESSSASMFSRHRGVLTRRSEKMLFDYFGLHINTEGKIVDEDGNGFQFHFSGDETEDQLRYDHIGQIMELYVYEELQLLLSHRRYLHPGLEKGPFIFASDGYEKSDHLLVLINGSGVVKAGQWSRRLILNDRLESGSQIPYVKKILRRGWHVLVMNPNDNVYKPPVEGSKDPLNHGLYVWKQFISGEDIKKIAIVAHSSGGTVIAEIMAANREDFQRRVLAIAFTDAVCRIPKDAMPYFKSVTKNWVPSKQPLGTSISSKGIETVSAGTTEHIRTSHKAISDVFKYISERFDSQP